MRWITVAGFALVTAVVVVRADDPSPPPPVAVSRPEMKQALEDQKKAKPRLPLPPPTEQEKAAAGDRPLVNNARMRALYLDPALRDSGSSRDPDPNMSLERKSKTMLFWVVSRANNCQYCLGHQEIGLSRAGLTDDQIAALDGDWQVFAPAEQAALDFARTITYRPHTINDAAIDKLRKHYKDLQILEILVSLCGNNSTNRWTGGLNIPQDEDSSRLFQSTGTTQGEFRFASPTAEKYRARPSEVAPLGELKAGAKSAPPSLPKRPALESRSQVEEALAACRKRESRLPLVDEAKAREGLPADWSKEPLPQWVRLLANFPKQGVARAGSVRNAQEKGVINPRLKAQIAWIAAREDRAWYALGHAKLRLKALDLSDDEIYSLDNPGEKVAAADRVVFDLARKLTLAPSLVSDADVEAVRKHYKDNETAELVYHVCTAAFFNRLTEAAGLQLEK